ncbi:anti-sigma factor [Shewanella avicenniae]|uniref:Anti-sigma-E factor RseA n=1 Tax=Shewanella avicenniae TaxID=2814294 RepID=A0ABX7QTA2_9GAMM|nr:RseA family anti-sigma factor [Shewanella avicenniae]QSX34707.1 anti-sigma factor [Shewanella avicenniae]
MEKFGQEWVSAVVDGETDSHALAELASDKASHEKWRNYHMIGDAMRGELPETIDLDLTARIAEAIELEPTVIAPVTQTEVQPAAIVVQGNTAKVVPFYKQFGQYAIAATVAMMAIVGVQNMNQEQAAPDTGVPALVTRPLLGSASPVSYQGPAAQQQGYTNEQLRDQSQRINSYLQDHLLQQRLNAAAVVNNNKEETPAPANR